LLEDDEMVEKIPLRVNGVAHSLDVDPDKPLLYTLRDELGLNNPRFGCGLAQCGACTVLLNGQPVRSCVIPTVAVKNSEITTVAGLGTPENPHPLQTAYVEEQVPQCGYCSNGFMLTAAAFLKANKSPSDAEIRSALSGLKCRCGVHMAILRAVKRAASNMA
jgi:nicotinate dehydrogenase subunit A